jgi:hypothetical protein
MWVVRRVTSFDSMPPIAMAAPAIVSLSIKGRSAHVRTTLEKISLGSGEKGRTWACLPRATEVDTQLALTTGIIKAWQSMYCGNSMVLETICVAASTGIEPSSRGSSTVAPLRVTNSVSSPMVLGVSTELETKAMEH